MVARRSVGRLSSLLLLLLSSLLLLKLAAVEGHHRAYGVEKKLLMLRGDDGAALQELLPEERDGVACDCGEKDRWLTVRKRGNCWCFY